MTKLAMGVAATLALTIPLRACRKEKPASPQIGAIAFAQETVTVLVNSRDSGGSHITIRSLDSGGSHVMIRGGPSIAGSAEPRVYIDGVRSDSSMARRLADLNPDDIASVEILKGREAALLYGDSVSNGVILVFTKNFLTVPEVEEFPKPNLRFRVAADKYFTQAFIESLLRRARIEWAVREEVYQTDVITRYFPETKQGNGNDVHRVSIMMRISEASASPRCSAVSLAWLRQSKGPREERWRRMLDDQTSHAPAQVDSLVRQLEALHLGGGCQR